MTDFELCYTLIILSAVYGGLMFSMFVNLDERLKELESDD